MPLASPLPHSPSIAARPGFRAKSASAGTGSKAPTGRRLPEAGRGAARTLLDQQSAEIDVGAAHSGYLRAQPPTWIRRRPAVNRDGFRGRCGIDVAGGITGPNPEDAT